MRGAVFQVGVAEVARVCDGYLRKEVRSTSLNALLVGYLSRFPVELGDVITRCLNHITPDTVACGASEGKRRMMDIIPGSVSWEIQLGEFYDEWTGCRAWPGAFHMSRMLLNRKYELAGVDVLELGSGLGLCGIASMNSGAKSTTFTEYKQSLLDLSLGNASSNKPDNLEASTRGFILDWSDFNPETHQSFMEWKSNKHGFVVIGSELVYEDYHGDLVLPVLSALFRAGASRGLIVIMLRPSRPGVDHFLKSLRSLPMDSPFTARIEEDEADNDQLAACIYLDRA
jgi:predicted nicotinamide N-methyase